MQSLLSKTAFEIFRLEKQSLSLGWRLAQACREAAVGGWHPGCWSAQEQQQGTNPSMHAGGSGKLESEPLQGTGTSPFVSLKENLNRRAKITTTAPGKV